MRIALVCPYDMSLPGGVQRHVGSLRESLLGRGHEAWVVAPGRGEGVRSVGGSVRVRANRSVAPVALDPRSVRRLGRAVAGADVVHIHEPLMPLVSLGALVARTPPKVGTFHADPSTAIRRMLRLGAGPLRRLVERLRVATAVSPVAQSAVAAVTNARLVPIGLDVASFAVDVLRHPARVAFLGRDEPRKGLDVLLEAWPAVRTAVPGAELAVAGAQRPERIAGVTFFGRVGEEDKRAHLAGSAVYCAPNLGGESFGIVVLEGMAAGCAVVASAIPAFAAVVGQAGRLVPPGDAAALSRALIDLLSQPGETAAWGERARRRAADFDLESTVTEYEDAYAAATAGWG